MRRASSVNASSIAGLAVAPGARAPATGPGAAGVVCGGTPGVMRGASGVTAVTVGGATRGDGFAFVLTAVADSAAGWTGGVTGSAWTWVRFDWAVAAGSILAVGSA